jgi:glycosyltransferase involved in cell wall biosynthesis
MRTLLWGDMAATGFGTVTRDLGAAMVARGEDIRFLSINEPVGPLPEPFAGRTLSLGVPDGWLEADAAAILGNLTSIFVEGRDGWQPDSTIVVGDPASIIRSNLIQVIPKGFPAFHYVPIEGVGIPPTWSIPWHNRLQPVAMCQFGADQIASITGKLPPFVYHGVDTEAFYPVSQDRPIVVTQGIRIKALRSKEDCKAYIGLDPAAILLYRADRNMPRKRYPSMLRAVAPVLAAHPEAHLLMHCLTIDEGGNLDDFRGHLWAQYGPEVVKRMETTKIHDRGEIADRKLLNILYNAADLYLSTGAEGFGLTIAESLAAGTPVVGMDFSSVPEVIGDAGVLVPVGYLIENIYAYHWANVDEPKYTEAVEFLVTHKQRRRELGKLGPRHVERNFTWAKAAERFAEIRQPAEVAAA